VGIMRPYVADVLAGTSWLDDQILYDPRGTAAGQRGWRFWRCLRQQKFDAVVLLTNSLRTAVLAALSGARQRVGYARHGRAMLLTKKLYPPAANGKLLPRPTVDYYLDIARAMGCSVGQPPEDKRLELSTTPADESAADAVWRQYGLREGRVVVLNSSGAFGAAKLWPEEHSAELARRLAEALDFDVLVLCGPSERDSARRIVQRAAHPRVVSLADAPLGIGLSKACVRRARLMVTTDSGPRHFAVALGVPLVTLFGPTPAYWGHNPTSCELEVSTNLDCLGCHRRKCPLGHHRCMRDLSAEVVYQAVLRQLERLAARVA